MHWVVLSYSMPSGGRSGPRVTQWRRLRRLGVVTLAGGSHVLPARDECLEAFQWLAQEIRHAKGEAVVMRVQSVEGLTDRQIADLFNAARGEEYAAIEADATALEKTAHSKTGTRDPAPSLDELGRLRRRYAEVARVDYFACPEGNRVAAHLARLEHLLSPGTAPLEKVAPVRIADYRKRSWVTRPRPHVDRLACAWLIRRFVDSRAVIRYAARPEPGEIAFDMDEGEFGHPGNLCSFEKMLLAFGLGDPALQMLAEIVHEIDLRDGRYARPETAGVEAILAGWLTAGLSDAGLETNGIALFEGLYAAFSSQSLAVGSMGKKPKSKRSGGKP